MLYEKHNSRQRRITSASSPFFRFCQALLVATAMPILFPPSNRESSPITVQALSTTAPSKSSQQRLVLVGGGHAHAQVVKALNHKSRPSNMHVTLIDVQKSASYSGMVPGCVSRMYTPEQTLLHLEPLSDWAGTNFVHDRVIDMDLERKLIYLQNSPAAVSFDAVSIDIGSTARGMDQTPGAREYTIPTRPISDLIRRIDQAEEELVAEQKRVAHVVVIGSGAAGIELAMSMRGRWDNIVPHLRITLLNAGTELLPDESPACRSALNRLLEDRDIEVRHQCNVAQITKQDICLINGERIPYTHCLWATGAGAHSLAYQLQKRGLAVNDRGWIRVDENLQSLSHPCVFAAGDCASLEGLPNGPPPKAGVHAVRAGPVLVENLTRFLANKTPLLPFKPQDDFLKLLVCGDGRALGFRFGLPIYGKWVWELKDAIDQKFMNLFKRENLPDLEHGAAYDTSQYDAGFVEDRSDRLPPYEASLLLNRIDDNVDYKVAWQVFRDMTQDEEYREQVLQHMNSPLLVR